MTKVTFLGAQFRTPLLGVSMFDWIVLESLLEGSGLSFVALGQKVCAACEKGFFRTVFQSEQQESSIAKPCEPYSTSFKNRRGALDGLCPPTCVPEGFILSSQSLS